MQFVILVGLYLIGTSSQPLLLSFSFLTVLIIYKLFWKPFEPKALFFGLILFWLSIIVKLLYADVIGLSFQELSISPNILQTAYIAMFSLLVFSFGIFSTTRKLDNSDKVGYVDVYRYDTKKVILAYLLSILFKTIIGSLGGAFGLGEVFNALLLLRSSFVFILVYIYYKKNNGVAIPLLFISIEVVLSFFSYFSSFKDIIISFLVAFTYFKIELKVKQIFFLLFISVAGLYLLLLWQSIKSEYRNFLSGGERSQSVVVDRRDALEKFYSLISTANIFDPEVLYGSIDRLSYIEFFSQATDNVPSVIPFERGSIWKENINHVLVPRILDPNKKSIYDSEMVNKYATKKVAGADVGTSFSLGFLAESYIDFGYFFMYMPVFLLGVFFGSIYRYIRKSSFNHMWGCALVSPLWVYTNCNGTPGAKILGWMIMYLLVFVLINKYFIKRIDSALRSGTK